MSGDSSISVRVARRSVAFARRRIAAARPKVAVEALLECARDRARDCRRAIEDRYYDRHSHHREAA